MKQRDPRSKEGWDFRKTNRGEDKKNIKTPEKTGEEAGRRHRGTSQRRQSQKPDENLRGYGTSPESDAGRMNRNRRTKKTISLTLKKIFNPSERFLIGKKGREFERDFSLCFIDI